MKEYKIQPLDLMQRINAGYHEPFIHELIEFENRLDLIRLASALEKLANAFPLLKCRYDCARNSFVENKAFTAAEILKTNDLADSTTLLTESLDASEKLVQFTLSNNLLVITVSHLICDGSGFKNLIYLLCDFYNGKESGDLSYLMKRDFSQITENLNSAGITAKMLFSMLGNYKNAKIYDKTDEERVYLTEITIDAEIMAAVHGAAKRQGATLNDVFLTAYARALSKLTDRRKINLPCTVDLRKYAGGRAGIANLTGTYNLNVKIDAHKSFSESLRRVTVKMQKQKSTKNDVAGPLLLVSKYEKSNLESFVKLYGGMNTSPYTDYTNLGKLDENKLAFDGQTVKNAVGYGGLNKAPYFSVAVSSFRGATTVSSMFYAGENQAKKAEALLNGVASEILSFAK